MKPEDARSPPQHILGLTIRSRTRIYISYVLPNVLELLVYIVQIVADCAVSYQHFKSHQSDFGWATLSLIITPPIVTCTLILCSKNQWRRAKQNGTRVRFVSMQLLQIALFPFFVIYRSTKLIFWSIEALFHEDDDKVRMQCLEKAEECSTCELYRLVQAYGQSAPQIVLQLFHMLSQDLFRNFQTTNVQAISLIFSALDLASITTIYQRFESQKQVGRHYPWSTEEQKKENLLKIKMNKYFQEEYSRKKHQSERSLSEFPESDKIMEKFISKNQNNTANSLQTENNMNFIAVNQESIVHVSDPISHTVHVLGFDEVDNEAEDEQIALLSTHLTDDDKVRTNHVPNIPNVTGQSGKLFEFDEAPNTPPPMPPKARELKDVNEVGNAPQLREQPSVQNSVDNNTRRSKAFSQLETFKDMLLMNAQLYIKETVPRPPKMFIKRLEDSNNECNTPAPSPRTATDVVDFFLPTPSKVVKGIQQDDFASKTIAFFSWIAFIIMRMLSLAAFCVFFPKTFLIIMAVHYLLMLAALYLESHFHGTGNRTLFYFLLAYIYIYVLLEFRVKFKHLRIWFVGYFLLSMGENVTMTLIWYVREEFESWWFGFIFDGILYSGILFLATIIVYYLILKPKDVIFLVQDKSGENQINASATMTTEC